MRQDQRAGIVVRRPAGRGAGLLAEARHHEIGADRHGRPRRRAERGGARRVVDIRRIATPRTALIADHRGQHLFRLVPTAGITGAAVILGAHGLRENNRALVAELLDEDVVARRKIDVIGRVAAAGRAQVLRVERVLERENDAVHRHLCAGRIRAVPGVEFGGSFERVRVVAEHFADRRRAGRQGTERRMSVEFALAGHRTFAADVQCRERVELARIGLADDHAVLLVHIGVGGGRLHAAEFERRTLILIEIGKDRCAGNGLSWKGNRRTAPHGADYLGYRGAVLGHEQARDTVIGAHPRDVLPDDIDAIRAPGADCVVQFLYSCLFDAEGLAVGADRLDHVDAPVDRTVSIQPPCGPKVRDPDYACTTVEVRGQAACSWQQPRKKRGSSLRGRRCQNRAILL